MISLYQFYGWKNTLNADILSCCQLNTADLSSYLKQVYAGRSSIFSGNLLKMFLCFSFNQNLNIFCLCFSALTGGEQTHCAYGFCITLEAEITAEAGLCVVIPCSFYTPYFFTPQNMVWFKCHPYKQQCSDSDMIFHPKKNNKKVQSGSKERVSFLEPYVDKNNCSIVINDLTESDSGSYQFRVDGVSSYGRKDGFSFPFRTTVSVKGMKSYNNYI